MCRLQGAARAGKLEYLESNEASLHDAVGATQKYFASDCEPGSIAEPFAGRNQSKGVSEQRGPLTRGGAVKMTEPARDAAGRLPERMG